MSIRRVSSVTGGGAADGSTWANAYTTMLAAVNASAAGDEIWVDSANTETPAAGTTYIFANTIGNPVKMLCVTPNGASGNSGLATGASIIPTAGNALGVRGNAYIYGITLGANTTISLLDDTNNNGFLYFEACKFRLERNGSGNSDRVSVGQNGSNQKSIYVKFKNCSIRCKNSDQGISPLAPFEWTDSVIIEAGGTTPLNILKIDAGSGWPCVFRNCDLSALNSSSFALVLLSNSARCFATFIECKLGSGVLLTTGTVGNPGSQREELINCDSSNTTNRFQITTPSGDAVNETTIVRSSGATRLGTSYSVKATSSSRANFFEPLIAAEGLYDNTATGSSKNLTVEVITDNVTLNDDEAWVEIEYLGTSSLPYGITVTDRKTDYLATGAAQTSSSVTWTTTGLGTPVTQKLDASFTPQVQGVIRWRVMLAKASTTMYVDPKVTVT